ncbi:TPA: hypothetical protein NJ597_001243 [Vibrio parahaemolyticus]|nr:hypothetical protein [Vibrio parahaemolyticus]
MKFKKCLLVALLPFAVSAKAEEGKWYDFEWNNGKAMTHYHGLSKVDDGSVVHAKMFWVARINHSRAGEQLIYFDHTYSNATSCTPSEYPKNHVWKFNQQPVQMILWCKKYIDSNHYFLTGTALSEKGQKFIYDQFSSTEYDSVFIDSNEHNGWSVHIKNKGFIDAWNQSGGNAL